MKINVLTLFPEMIDNIAKESILGKAVESGAISINAVNIRDFTEDKHNRVDDYTYGGGAGMLIQAQPVYDCFMATTGNRKGRCIYVTPQGRPFTQKMAKSFAEEEELTILCGHYEGIDERVLEEIVTDYVSIGDYVLTGGELAAMVIVDAVARLVPTVLGNVESAQIESFHRNLLEYPQFTRPATWHDKEVPKELLCGDPKQIEAWRYEKSLERTRERRPDLLLKHKMEQDIISWLLSFKRDYVYGAEMLRRGICEVLVWDENAAVILRDEINEAVYIFTADENYNLDGLLTEEICDQIKDDDLHVNYLSMAKKVMDKFALSHCHEFATYVYTGREKKAVGADHDIRPLDLAHFDFVNANYEASEKYCQKLLVHTKLWGYFVNDELVGFVGEHFAGFAGVLFVKEEFRGKGIAKVLEQFMINQFLEKGNTLFCFVEKENIPSHELQKKMELYPGRKPVFCLFR